MSFHPTIIVRDPAFGSKYDILESGLLKVGRGDYQDDHLSHAKDNESEPCGAVELHSLSS